MDKSRMKRRRLLLKKETLTEKQQIELNKLNSEAYSMPIKIQGFDKIRDIANKLKII